MSDDNLSGYERQILTILASIDNSLKTLTATAVSHSVCVKSGAIHIEVDKGHIDTRSAS